MGRVIETHHKPRLIWEVEIDVVGLDDSTHPTICPHSPTNNSTADEWGQRDELQDCELRQVVAHGDRFGKIIGDDLRL